MVHCMKHPVSLFTCPPAAPILPVPSTMPVTVARASWLPLRASCLPKSADMAELIMLDGPPIKKPVVANSAALITWSLGESEKEGGEEGRRVKMQIGNCGKDIRLLYSSKCYLMTCVLTAVSNQSSHRHRQTHGQHRCSLSHEVRDQTLKCSTWDKPPKQDRKRQKEKTKTAVTETLRIITVILKRKGHTDKYNVYSVPFVPVPISIESDFFL